MPCNCHLLFCTPDPRPFSFGFSATCQVPTNPVTPLIGHSPVSGLPKRAYTTGTTIMLSAVDVASPNMITIAIGA